MEKGQRAADVYSREEVTTNASRVERSDIEDTPQEVGRINRQVAQHGFTNEKGYRHPSNGVGEKVIPGS